ncbi:MAG: protein phosphatase CheZ [Bacteroidota bacterium]|jgi:chemotaxis regulatin CheY-phosphate phosphatase CheZ
MQPKDLYHALPADSVPEGTTLDQLLSMLRSIMPVLDEMKDSVEKSSSKIPKATQQLTNVTEATENATMEILNFIDDIGARIGSVEEKLKQIELDLSKKEESVRTLMRVVESMSPEQKRVFLPYAQEWKNLTDLSLHVEMIGELRKHLSDVQEISMNIAMALQVQDITSQQIESVRHLIESVRTQLGNIVGRYEGNTAAAPDEEEERTTFDEHARYNKDSSRQEDADSIIAQFIHHEPMNGSPR